MKGNWTETSFRKFEAPLRELVDDHVKDVDEPLHLAIAYLPPRRPKQNVYLLEVVGREWSAGWQDDKDLFEVSFLSNSGFPLREDAELRFALTNPEELEFSVQNGWPLAKGVVSAVSNGDFQVLHSDDIGNQCLRALESAASKRKAVRG